MARSNRRPNVRTLKTLLVLAAFSLFAHARAADLGQPVMLVASPQLNHAIYGGSVIVAAPIGDGLHIGFIVNRPTKIKLGQLFPEHSPSQKVVDPVYFGGPADAGLLFAIVERGESPGGATLPLANGLFLTFDGPTVDRIIETEPEHARFYTGLVTWRPGELQDEVSRGLWYVVKPEASIVLRHSTQHLWDEMLTRSRLSAGAI
jgi:putative transcriptional regulator